VAVPATTEKGLELGALEVTVTRRDEGDAETDLGWGEEYTDTETVRCPKCDKDVDVEVTVSVERPTVARMDAVFEALRRKGIDIGRPFVIHVDQITGITTARQEAWSGE
jgi:hypothetical protein